MKRILIAVIALIYFTISSGVVMNMHYCMGKLSSIQMEQLASEGTCKCGKKKKAVAKDGCCKTEQKVVKLADSHKATYADFVFQLPEVTPGQQLNLLDAPLFNGNPDVYADAHAPPMLSEQDIYLQHCVFRI